MRRTQSWDYEREMQPKTDMSSSRQTFSGFSERLTFNISRGVVIVLVKGQMEDCFVSDLLTIVLIKIIVNISGRLQCIRESSEVIVLQTSLKLALNNKWNGL